ncbi:hypothetical protein BC834DRAFT_894896 [Gloeopeniophorella convolvens]|nr:hypothetical protein BC834DRAFT_894896 [Gloeopeniophorella convolvens]
MYRYEVRLRTGLLGEPAKHIRPLSENKAIENGANFIAEGFLFSVAAALIISETWRSSRSQSRQRSDTRVKELSARLESWEETSNEERQRCVTRRCHVQLTRILERVVDIGLRGAWAEMQDTPLQIPRIQFSPPSSSLSPHRRRVPSYPAAIKRYPTRT